MKRFVIALAAASMFTTPAFAEDLYITIRNNTDSTLTQVFVSHVGTNDWEDNVLGSDVPSGGTLSVTIADGRSTCDYDIKAVFDDGGSVEFRDENLCEVKTFTVHD
jgi:hypothetical protein